MIAELDRVDNSVEEGLYKPGLAGTRLKRSGAPIWALMCYYKYAEYAAHEDLEHTARDYEPPMEEVAAALEGYRGATRQSMRGSR